MPAEKQDKNTADEELSPKEGGLRGFESNHSQNSPHPVIEATE